MRKEIKPIALLCGFVMLLSILGLKIAPASSQDGSKPEQIDATAKGTGTQLGNEFNMTLIIDRYSTPEDRQTLKEAFQKDKNQGLYNALSKMKPVGHISIKGGLGYDVSYIRLIPTATGRTIRFVTNRPITIREAEHDTLSSQYNLTAGDFQLNDQDKNKSTGVLYPLAKLTMDNDNQVKFDLDTNPFTLTDVIDWGQNNKSSEVR